MQQEGFDTLLLFLGILISPSKPLYYCLSIGILHFLPPFPSLPVVSSLSLDTWANTPDQLPGDNIWIFILSGRSYSSLIGVMLWLVFLLFLLSAITPTPSALSTPLPRHPFAQGQFCLMSAENHDQQQDPHHQDPMFAPRSRYSAVVLGGSGAVGSNVLRELMRSPVCGKITAIGRRKIECK